MRKTIKDRFTRRGSIVTCPVLSTPRRSPFFRLLVVVDFEVALFQFIYHCESSKLNLLLLAAEIKFDKISLLLSLFCFFFL